MVQTCEGASRVLVKKLIKKTNKHVPLVRSKEVLCGRTWFCNSCMQVGIEHLDFVKLFLFLHLTKIQLVV
jgi:hypothetical protein